MSEYLKQILAVLSLGLLVTACSSLVSPASETEFEQPISNRTDQVHEDGDIHSHIDPDQASAEIQLVLVPSELILGPNRFAVGLFDTDGGLVHEADVHFHYYDLSDPQKAVLESEVNAQRLQTPDGTTTIFVHERDFGRAGEWGAEIQVSWPDGRSAFKRISFEVLADSASLVPGEKAPLLRTPTLSDVDQNLSRLTTASKPNPAIHRHSLAAALSNSKPTLLLFATPGFCQTRFCGPAYEIVSELQSRYTDRLNYVYVEIFSGLPDPDANGWQIAPAVAAFGLQSEPWVYLIDEQGTIVYRVEGMFTTDEIERHLRADVGLQMRELAAAQAEYRQRSWQQRVHGTALPLCSNSVMIYLGSDFSGPVIGTAQVDTTGAWAFNQSNSPKDPVAVRTISVRSSRGGQVIGFTLTVRR